MEASGHGRRFERLMGALQIELWIGDAAEIRTKRLRKQKTDRQDAQLILKFMLKDDFADIIRELSRENRDLRQLLTASASHGANAHADHESFASGGAERRSAV
jgi:hypothetical protein